MASQSSSRSLESVWLEWSHECVTCSVICKHCTQKDWWAVAKRKMCHRMIKRGRHPTVAKYLEAGQSLSDMLHDPVWLCPCLERYKLKTIQGVRAPPNLKKALTVGHPTMISAKGAWDVFPVGTRYSLSWLHCESLWDRPMNAYTAPDDSWLASTR